ncbi:MAG: cell division protein FtsZ [Candidatus Dadabacteria bacterium]|nr:MAG: cell division protein FtsZ [Candidatus Dadabacteria bacterium]
MQGEQEMIYELEQPKTQATIKVIGVGGGGGNAVDTMIMRGLDGVDFIVANTDAQALDTKLAPTKIQIGTQISQGLGAGADPSVGRQAAEEDRERLREVLEGSDMVFVTAGMGKGTGTGAAPIVAQVAKEVGALTVAIVTTPFSYEGRQRARNAEYGVQELVGTVDTLITIPNDRLLSLAKKDTSFKDAFRLADLVLYDSVRGISDVITVPGIINTDFADVRTVMANRGMAVMGSGEASGDTRAIDAAQQAIMSPLLEDADIDGATAVLVNFSATDSLTLQEINEACSFIQERVHEEANIIMGVAEDPKLGDKVRITVLATGFGNAQQQAVAPPLRAVPAPQRTQDTTLTGDRVRAAANAPGESVYERFGKPPYDDDERSRPAFLRKQM